VILAAFAVPAAFAGAASMYWALGSLGPYRQVLRRESRPVSDVVAGPVEITGTLRAVDAPLLALDGTRAIAIRTLVWYSYVLRNRRSRSGVALDVVDAAPAEIRDDSGACRLDDTSWVLLGETKQHHLSPAEFRERCRNFGGRVAASNATQFFVEQTVVPDGAVGRVSGEADPNDGGAEAGDGYRGEGRRRYRLGAGVARPMIVSAFPEPKTRAILLRPAWLFGWIAFAWFGIAAALAFADHFLGG
jgi:hypothetical protein